MLHQIYYNYFFQTEKFFVYQKQTTDNLIVSHFEELFLEYKILKYFQIYSNIYLYPSKNNYTHNSCI